MEIFIHHNNGIANNKQKREKCEADLNKFIKVNYREHIIRIMYSQL